MRDVGAIRVFDPDDVAFTEPADAYPPAVLPMIPPAELVGSRVKIHHRGTDREPQLLEVQVDPGLELAAHAHDSTEIIVVIEGEVRLGARRCGPGVSVLVPGGTLYAVQAGPDGARFLNFRGIGDYTYYDKAAFLARRAGAAPDPEGS